MASKSAKLSKFIEQKSRFRPFSPGSKSPVSWTPKENAADYYAIIPPIENYMGVCKEDALVHIWNGFEKNDIVIGRVSSVHEHGLSLLLLCADAGKSKDLECHKIYAWCPVLEIPKQTNHEDVLSRFASGDIIRCKISSIDYKGQELIVSQYRSSNSSSDLIFGKLEVEDLPVAYQRQISGEESYEKALTSSVGFVNPNNVQYLLSKLNIPSDQMLSLMKGLHNKIYPKEDFAEPLRRHQSRKHAERSVKKGIEKFRSGKHIESLQDFNYALDIDCENVNALVARGALYANRGSLSRAIHDFEGALKLEPSHKNAQTYLVEVLVERARQIETQIVDMEQVKEVEQCYKRALQLDGNCEEARKALGEIESRKEKEREERKRNRKRDSSEDSSDEGKFAATAEKLRKMLKETPNSKRRTLSSSSKKSREGKSRRSSTKQEESDEDSTSSSSSASTSSSSSSSSTSSSERGKTKRRKRRKSSTSSSSSSDEHKHRRGRRKSSNRVTSKSSNGSNTNHSKDRIRSSSSLDKRETGHSNLKARRHSSHFETNDRQSRRSSSRRNSDILHDNANRQATIKSDYPTHRRTKITQISNESRIPAIKSHTSTNTKRPSPNLANVTKDNFKNILHEITKFESTSKKGH